MQYNISADQEFLIDFSLSLSQGAVLNYYVKCPVWARWTDMNGRRFYHISRNKVISEFPAISMKPDTVYRINKALEKACLIVYRTDNKKDFIALSPVLEYWMKKKDEIYLARLDKMGLEAKHLQFEKEALNLFADNSEKNPSKAEERQELGKKSETARKKIRDNSEKNPTNKNNSNKNTNNKNKELSSLFAKKAVNDPELRLIERLNPKNLKHAGLIYDVTAHFIEKTGKKQTKPYTQGMFDKVVYWANRGYRLEDFKKVIDFKVWYFTEKFPKPENINLVSFIRKEHFETNLSSAQEWQENPAQGSTEAVKGDIYYSRFVKFIENNYPQFNGMVPNASRFFEAIRNNPSKAQQLRRVVNLLAKENHTPNGQDFITLMKKFSK